MKYLTALREPVRNRLELIEKADLVVGIPCFNNQNTIAHVINQTSLGLHQYFPEKRSVIIVSDGGSVDDSREEAMAAKVAPFQELLVSIYRGVPGKGSALRAVLEVGKILRAQACVVVDSDLRSITPQWIRNLLSPVLKEKYQFVAPYYKRFKLDGTITNNIVYKMTRALYGKRVRQPIGGDFAFSDDLINDLYSQDVWDTDVGRFGIDVWLTTNALVRGYRICQTRLGAKIHDPKDPSESLGPMFRQVVATLFSLMEDHHSFWKDVSGSEPVPILGEEINIEPKEFPVDVPALIEKFKSGYLQFGSLWQEILSADSFAEIKRLFKTEGLFHMDERIWPHILYEAVSVYHCWPRNRFKLVELLTPLYYGRVASNALAVEDMTGDEAEENVERQAAIFEAEKPYLLERWSLAERRITDGSCGKTAV